MNIWKKDIVINDMKTGLIVCLVALPLCLGISLASGAPLAAGLIAGIIGGLVIAPLSNSHVSVSGPAAGLAVVVLMAIQNLGDYQIFLLSVALAGLMQILMGLMNAGKFSSFIPTSVIKGMLSAIGIIILFKQIPYALGLEGTKGLSGFIANLANVQLGPTIISLTGLSLLLLCEKSKLGKWRLFQIIPPTLFVVVLCALMAWIFSHYLPALALNTSQFVSLGEITAQGLFSSFTHPDFSHWNNLEVYKTAAIIAIIASIETLLCIEAGDKSDFYKRKTSTKRELMAQGSGNFISGLLGGIPLTSVIIRTSVNINSGAKSKLSAIFHSLFLFAGVLIFPHFIEKIPLASLAAILILTGIKLANKNMMIQMIKNGADQAVPFFTTVIFCYTTDLLMGVCLGLIASLAFILWYNFKIQHEQIVIAKSQESEQKKLALFGHVTVLNKEGINTFFETLKKGDEVILDFSSVKHIDFDVKQVINEFMAKSDDRGLRVKMINPKSSFDHEIQESA